MSPTPEFDYRKYLQLVWRRKHLFVLFALVIMTSVAVVSYLLPEKYEAKCTVFIEKSVISDLVKGIAVTPSVEDKTRVLAYAMKSRTLLLKVFNDLDMNITKRSDAQQEKMIKDFQDKTDIRLKDREGLFIISFNHENPRLARDYVNTLVRRYIEGNTSSKREDSYDATKFLSEQIATIKERFEQAEARVNEFKREKGSILAQNEAVILSEIGDAQRKIEEIGIRRNQLESLRIQAMKTDPLKAKLAALQKRLNELDPLYTDSYPEVIEVKTTIASIREQMKTGAAVSDSMEASQFELDRIAMELRTLQATERNQVRFIAVKRAQMKSIPAAKATLDDLEREKLTQKNLYEQLMARHGQSEVSKQMEVQDKAATFRIVDPAVTPVKPVGPNRVRIIVFGILFGMVGSFAFLILLDYLDKSVRTIETLKSLGVPVLAIVPKIQNQAQLQAIRKREIRFFAASGVYFALILATLSIEFLRNYWTIDMTSPARIVQDLTQLTETIFK